MVRSIVAECTRGSRLARWHYEADRCAFLYSVAMDQRLPAVLHVNDIASVATTLMAEQRRRGRTAEFLDLPKPGASLPDPWKLALVPVRVG